MDAETKHLVRCLIAIFFPAALFLGATGASLAEMRAQVKPQAAAIRCECDLECEWVRRKIREEQKPEKGESHGR
jgi:hypothetical protein